MHQEEHMHQDEQMDEEEYMHKRKILLEGGTLQSRGAYGKIFPPESSSII